MIQPSRTSRGPDAFAGTVVQRRSSSAGRRPRSGWSFQEPRRRAKRPVPSDRWLANRTAGSFSRSINEPAFQALASALKAKDQYTWDHSRRVGAYASGVARHLGFQEEEIGHIRLAGELHDVGKIGVPGRLLRKCGSLTVNEYRQVMEHPAIGGRIIGPLLPNGHPILGAVRWHHEQFDGQGGPDGLTAEEIPLAARIVAVADAFDAMTSTRPYRSPLQLDVALKELDDNAGSQFDPACVQALRSLYPAGSPVGTLQLAVPA